MARRTIQVGDFFVRDNAKERLWMVESIFRYTDIPAHARLREIGSTRVVTFALNVLESSNQFRFVERTDEAKKADNL